jgi:uncharacterized protein
LVKLNKVGKISVQRFLNSDQDQEKKTLTIKIKEKDPFFQVDENFRVKLKLRKLNDQRLLIDFSVPIRLKLNCARCLTEFNYQSLLKFQRLYRSDQTDKTDKDDSELITDGKIDIKKPIKEEIILNLPLKPLCQPDCKGLCPSCGQNLNIKKCDCQPKPSGHPAFRQLKSLK